MKRPKIYCDDCHTDIVALGEYYMVNPAIWDQQLKLGWEDNLCIGCLEKRLDRKLTMHDFSSWPSYRWMRPSSIRLTSRIWGGCITTRKPYRLRASVRGKAHIPAATVRAIGEFLAAERGQRHRDCARRPVVIVDERANENGGH